MKEWFKPVIIAIDQLAQCFFFMKSIPGETISARACKARKRDRKWGCILCRVLDWIQPDHCRNALINDIKRAQAVIDDLKDYID